MSHKCTFFSLSQRLYARRSSRDRGPVSYSNAESIASPKHAVEFVLMLPTRFAFTAICITIFVAAAQGQLAPPATRPATQATQPAVTFNSTGDMLDKVPSGVVPVIA